MKYRNNTVNKCYHIHSTQYSLNNMYIERRGTGTEQWDRVDYKLLVG